MDFENGYIETSFWEREKGDMSYKNGEECHLSKLHVGKSLGEAFFQQCHEDHKGQQPNSIGLYDVSLCKISLEI